jgi:hypothetical protein
MQLAEINHEQAATMVAALGAVATARGTEEPSAADRAVIAAAALRLLGGPAVPDQLAASIPGEVAEHLDTPEARLLTLNIASILTFADVRVSEDEREGCLDPVRVTIVDDLARYLRVSALEVIELRRRTKHHRDRVAYDLLRRFPVSSYGDQMTMVHAALAESETRLDIDARRVHALWERIEGLPDGTVGSELIRYYHENGWTYPGTDHHQPLTFAEHDFHHVLGGYATTPAGELQVGAFTAGVADRPMDCVLYFLMWEQLGTGCPSNPGVSRAFEPEPIFAALERGARTTGDFVGTGWDPWSIVDLDIDQMRVQYEIGPGAQLRGGDPYDRDPVTADRSAGR